MQNVLVVADNERLEAICASTDPVTEFKGRDLGEIGPYELTGVFSQLTGAKLKDVLIKYNYLNPICGDENGPWLTALPMPIVSRLGELTQDDLKTISDEWNELEQELLGVYEEELVDMTLAQLNDMLPIIAQMCVESIRNNKTVFLWVNI